LVIFWQIWNIGAKAARKMSVKLTIGFDAGVCFFAGSRQSLDVVENKPSCAKKNRKKRERASLERTQMKAF